MTAYILEDMKQPISYLITGSMAAIASYPFIKWIFNGMGRKQMDRKQSTSLFLMVVYLAVLAETVYFSRPSFSRDRVNLTLMGTWGTTFRSHAYVIENVMLFVPFGILLPLCLPKAHKSWACILSGCFISILIETVQYITQRGNCELDDIIMNTLGTAAGWGIYGGGRKIREIWRNGR